LAELSGVSFGAVHNYGLGIRQPTFAAVVRIARALGVTCDAFSGSEDVSSGPAGKVGKSPASVEATPRGRPRKPAAEPAPPPAKKGRRKKE
jgi:transcriptional regulator with XRE-family HTH domain